MHQSISSCNGIFKSINLIKLMYFRIFFNFVQFWLSSSDSIPGWSTRLSRPSSSSSIRLSIPGLFVFLFVCLSSLFVCLIVWLFKLKFILNTEWDHGSIKSNLSRLTNPKLLFYAYWAFKFICSLVSVGYCYQFISFSTWSH